MHTEKMAFSIRHAQQMALPEAFRRAQQLFAARAGLQHVDGREDAAIGDGAIEDQLHVAGALELLKDHLVHATAGLDQSRRQDREASAVLAVARRAEELTRCIVPTDFPTVSARR